MMYNSPFSIFPYYKKSYNSNKYNYLNNYYSNNYFNKNKYPSNFANKNLYNDPRFAQSTQKYNISDSNNNFEKTLKEKENKKEEIELKEIFEIFGLKLYFDDILLICLIFFLYNEGVKDYYLFISLILLLLT